MSEPHRWALIYGSTIPGYAAPQETIAPAGRVVQALFAPVADADPRPDGWHVGRTLAGQLDLTRDALELEVSRETTLGLVAGFSRLVGALTLELNGQFVGGFEPADDLFAALVEREADALGL